LISRDISRESGVIAEPMQLHHFSFCGFFSILFGAMMRLFFVLSLLLKHKSTTFAF